MDKHAAIKIADEYVESGYFAYEENEYIKAVQFADSAMELYSYFDEKHKICETLNLKGKILGAKGNETASLEKYLEGVEFAEENSFDDMLVIFYNNIGFRYEYIEEYDKAIIYYNLAYEYFKKLEQTKTPNINQLGIKLSINFFDMYLEKKDIQKVEKYYKDIKFYLAKIDSVTEKKAFQGALTLREGILAWNNNDDVVMKNKIKKIMILLNNNFFDEAVWYEYPVLVDFLLEAKQYLECGKVIDHFLKNAIKKDDLEAKISATKFQIKLYRKEEKTKEYQDACIKYVEFLEDKDLLIRREKGYALDFKIAIRKIDAARKKAENLLEIDNLTKIKNRYSLNKEADSLFEIANRKNETLVLGILDIDGFKEVNGKLGHIGGDNVLIAAAKRIKEVIKSKGSVYRLGGDEFIVLCKRIDSDELIEIANRIKFRLKEIPLSISQGYVRFIPKKDEKIEEVIARADKLLYQIKEQGKDDFAIKNEDCK